LKAVLDHGIALDAMVVATGPASDPPAPATLYGVPVVAADMGRPDGSGHDPERLAAVLRLLT